MSSTSFSEFLMELIVRVFIILPAPLLVFFVLSLVLFLIAPKGSEKRKKRKTWFIIVTVVGGIMFLIWLVIVGFFVMALSHM